VEEPYANLILGRIVWATLPDSNGRPCELHRFVIVVPPSSASHDAELAVVGISTRRPAKGRENDCVKLKWMNRRGGHPVTRLDKESFAHCEWLVSTTIDAIEDIAGYVGESEMVQIRKILARLQASGQ